MSQSKVIRVAVAGGALFTLLGAGAWWLARDRDSRTWRYWQKRLPQSVAEARAAGIVTSMAEAKEPSPAGVNGAPLIEAAFATFEAANFKPGYYSWRRMYEKGGKNRAEVVREVRRFAPQIPGSLAASRADYYRWDVDPGRFYEGVGHTGRVISSLTIGATILTLEGDSQRVETAFVANRNLRQVLTNLGTERALSTASLMRKQAAQQLAWMAANSRVDSALVEKLAETLRDEPFSLKHALRFEAMCRMGGFESGRHSDWMQPDAELKDIVDPAYFVEWKTFYNAPESVLREANSGWVLHHMADQWAKPDRSILEMAHAAPNPEARFEVTIEKPLPLDYFALYYSSLEEMAATWMEGKVQADLCIAATSIHLYKRQHGVWPTDLWQVASAPQDPWSGEAFQYQRSEDRFYLWSVGNNGKNDWGRSVKNLPQGDDICFSSQLGEVVR
jgi:hypothetical protein